MQWREMDDAERRALPYRPPSTSPCVCTAGSAAYSMFIAAAERCCFSEGIDAHSERAGHLSTRSRGITCYMPEAVLNARLSAMLETVFLLGRKTHSSIGWLLEHLSGPS
jgi:hypothetical protein